MSNPVWNYIKHLKDCEPCAQRREAIKRALGLGRGDTAAVTRPQGVQAVQGTPSNK